MVENISTKALTYKDLDLITSMAANGFGLDSIFYQNGYMYVEMSRYEGEGEWTTGRDKVHAIIQQSAEGCKVFERKSND